MPDLNFRVLKAEPVTFAAAPTLALKLEIVNKPDTEFVQSIMLQTQIQIEAVTRHYNPAEQRRLLDLFGTPERWSKTLKTTLWTHVNTTVRPFQGSTTADLLVPCSFDFNVAATKYFHALEEGEVPLSLLFSGTVFYLDAEENLRIAQVSWDKEARYRFPVQVWKEMIEHYYPNAAWLTLRRDVFERLLEFKTEQGIPTWEQAVERLLSERDTVPRPSLAKGTVQ